MAAPGTGPGYQPQPPQDLPGTGWEVCRHPPAQTQGARDHSLATAASTETLSIKSCSNSFRLTRHQRKRMVGECLSQRNSASPTTGVMLVIILTILKLATHEPAPPWLLRVCCRHHGWVTAMRARGLGDTLHLWICPITCLLIQLVLLLCKLHLCPQTHGPLVFY